MKSIDTIKAAVSCVFFGVVLLKKALKHRKQAQVVEDTARSKLATAVQGHCEVQGFAWPKGETNKAPDGGERVYYSLQLQRQERQGSGKNRRTTWVTVYTFRFSQPFYIVDPTGLAVITPEDADLNLSGARTKYWHQLSVQEKTHIQNSIPEGISGFPPNQGFFGLFGRQFRIVENEIRLGSPLLVSGTFKTPEQPLDRAKELGLTMFSNKVFNLESRGFKNIDAILDKNGDGKISEVESRSGYSAAGRWARQKAVKENPVEQEYDVHGVFANDLDHALLVADAHERYLVSRLKRFNTLQLGSGWALIFFGIMLPISVWSPQWAQRNARAPASVESHQPVVELHRKCFEGDAVSCTRLLDDRTYYRLNADYIQIYEKQGCKLGITRLCSSGQF